MYSVKVILSSGKLISKIEESQGKKEECELAEMNKIETQYSE